MGRWRVRMRPSMFGRLHRQATDGWMANGPHRSGAAVSARPDGSTTQRGGVLEVLWEEPMGCCAHCARNLCSTTQKHVAGRGGWCGRAGGKGEGGLCAMRRRLSGGDSRLVRILERPNLLQDECAVLLLAQLLALERRVEELHSDDREDARIDVWCVQPAHSPLAMPTRPHGCARPRADRSLAAATCSDRGSSSGSCSSPKYGCSSACAARHCRPPRARAVGDRARMAVQLRRKDGSGASAAEMRCAGSKCSSLERRSSAWGEAAGNLPTYQRQWVATADRGSPRLRGDSQRRMRRRRGDPVASKACV